MRNRRAIEPSQLARKRRRRRLAKFYFWFISLIIIIIGVALLTHLKSLSINEVVVSGNEVETADVFLKIVKANTASNYFWLFSKNSIFFFPENKIKADILATNKRVRTIIINRTSLESIKLTVTERKPVGIFANVVGTSYSSARFFIDKEGYIFARAPELSGNIFFTYSGLINSADPIGQSYLSPAEFTQLNNFIGEVKKLGANIIGLQADDANDFELKLLGGGKILFTTAQPLQKLLDNLQIIISDNSSGSKIDLSKVEYLNLRNGNKIVYKLRGGATSTPPQN